MSMTKAIAIQLIGPSLADAAKAVGVTRQAIGLWPDPLPKRIEDRVLAVQARRHLPPHLLGQHLPRITANRSSSRKARGRAGQEQSAD